MTRHGKRLLRKAFELAKVERGVTLASIGKAIGCSHPQVRTMLYDEETLGVGTAPTWSSSHLEALCGELRVPLWMVVSGIRPDQRKVISALERVREFTPERYKQFLDGIVEQADDRAARGGWRDEDTTGSRKLRPARELPRTGEDED